MKFSRRQFFKLMGLGSASLLAPRIVLGEANGSNDDDIIISIFLRGAADGLNIVPPYGDQDYYRLRPSLAIAPPGDPDGALDLDGFFGLHPGMEALLPIYHSGDLAVVHACGSPHPSHSHFQAQDLMERGRLDNTGSFEGWLGRYLDYADDGSFSIFHAIAMGNAVPRILAHQAPTIALPDIDGFALKLAEQEQDEMQSLLKEIYAGSRLLDQRASETLEAIDALSEADPGQYPVENGADYPDTPFGRQLRTIGQMIRAGVGLRASAISLGGWDTHQGEATTLDSLTRELAQALAAFHTDMGDEMQRITLITHTEFGRRAYENGSAGTDHGHASFMLALGANVKGGQVHADWPGLRDQDLYGAGDLEVTIDYRNVLGELISKRTAGMPMEQLFPDLVQVNFPGVFL